MTARFLVVDDDEITAEMLRDLLLYAYDDVEVRLALDNESAFKVIERFAPSLITTDINRPGGDGYEFLTKIRNDPMLRHVPVIAISGSNKSEEIELLQYRHGFNTVLPKPFSLQKFLSTIDNALNLRANPDAVAIHAGFESRDRD